jgi:hypothetical protein
MDVFWWVLIFSCDHLGSCKVGHYMKFCSNSERQRTCAESQLCFVTGIWSSLCPLYVCLWTGFKPCHKFAIVQYSVLNTLFQSLCLTVYFLKYMVDCIFGQNSLRLGMSSCCSKLGISSHVCKHSQLISVLFQNFYYTPKMSKLSVSFFLIAFDFCTSKGIATSVVWFKVGRWTPDLLPFFFHLLGVKISLPAYRHLNFFL